VPAAVIVFPGSGIIGNLAGKAKKLRIRALDRRGGAYPVSLEASAIAVSISIRAQYDIIL
jgi:hypothetical protein